MIIKMKGLDISELLLSYTRTTAFTDYLTGNVPTQQLDISLDNVDGDFDYITVKDAIFEVQPTDTSDKLYFKAYEMPETWDKVIDLKLYDCCRELDKLYATCLAYPATIRDQIAEMSQISGVNIDISNVPDYVLERTVGWYDSTIVIREYLGWIACLFNANIIPSKEYGKVRFEILTHNIFAKYDDLMNYKKGNDYCISKVIFNNGFILERGFETDNSYILDSGNLYITSQEDIDIIYDCLHGLSLTSATNIEADYIDNLHLGHIINCFDEFNFIVKCITEKYVGGSTPDYELSGELSTSNQESVSQKISDNVKIKRLKIMTDEINTEMSIVAEQTEGNTKDINGLKISLEGIETEVSKTSNSIYKFETGHGNIFDNCHKLLSKDINEPGIKYISDMQLGINKDYMQGKDLCISVDIQVISAIIGNLGNYIGAEFEVGYADGTKKLYSTRWYLGQYSLQYLLQTSTVDHEERIWAHFKIEDKEITSVSNLKMIIAFDCEKAIVANPKVEFGTFPTGFEFDVNYIRDNVETIQKDYTEIKQEVGSLSLQAVSMEEQITTIKGDVNSVTTRLQSAEIKLEPTNILLAVNEKIGIDGQLYTTKFILDKNGVHISGGGLDIVNNQGVKVLYADTGGNLVINNLTAVNGEFTGKVTATSGSFTGAVYATSGSFKGSIDATSGTFRGAVYASSGSFSGSISSNDGTIGGWYITNSGLANGTTKINNGGITNIYTWADLYVIRLIITGVISADSDVISHYDFNGDGNITSSDYVNLKNRLKAL